MNTYFSFLVVSRDKRVTFYMNGKEIGHALDGRVVLEETKLVNGTPKPITYESFGVDEDWSVVKDALITAINSIEFPKPETFTCPTCHRPSDE